MRAHQRGLELGLVAATLLLVGRAAALPSPMAEQELPDASDLASDGEGMVTRASGAPGQERERHLQPPCHAGPPRADPRGRNHALGRRGGLPPGAPRAGRGRPVPPLPSRLGRAGSTSCRATTSPRARSAGTGSRRTRRARRSRCGAVAYLARATPALAVRVAGRPREAPGDGLTAAAVAVAPRPGGGVVRREGILRPAETTVPEGATRAARALGDTTSRVRDPGENAPPALAPRLTARPVHDGTLSQPRLRPVRR